MKKIFLIISIVTLVTTVGFAQEATDNRSTQETTTAPTEKPATATPDSAPAPTVAPAPTPATTPAPATNVAPATAPTEADKSYQIYAEGGSDDNYKLPINNMIYIMAFANLGIPLTSDNDFTSLPSVGANVAVGAVFKKYVGVELNLGYLTNDYYDDDNYYDSYRGSRYNSAERYKNSAELYNIKLYLTGNLPFDFGNMRIMPYVAVGGAVTFSVFNWYESSVINPTLNIQNKNYSFDVSVGPTAKVGVKYFYKGLVVEVNVEYLYAFHNSIRSENLSYIGLNAGIGFAF